MFFLLAPMFDVLDLMLDCTTQDCDVPLSRDDKNPVLSRGDEGEGNVQK